MGMKPTTALGTLVRGVNSAIDDITDALPSGFAGDLTSAFARLGLHNLNAYLGINMMVAYYAGLFMRNGVTRNEFTDFLNTCAVARDYELDEHYAYVAVRAAFEDDFAAKHAHQMLSHLVDGTRSLWIHQNQATLEVDAMGARDAAIRLIGLSYTLAMDGLEQSGVASGT